MILVWITVHVMFAQTDFMVSIVKISVQEIAPRALEMAKHAVDVYQKIYLEICVLVI